MPEERDEASRGGDTVASTKTATDAPPQQSSVVESSKRILKSTSSVNKSSGRKLDVKATEIKSPIPIPEDPMEEEISEQSTLSDERKKADERNEFNKEDVQKQPEKKSKETSEEDKSAEQKKEEKADDKDERQQSENTQGNNSDNAEEKIPKSNEQNDEEKRKVNMQRIPENVPIHTTKLRGKSKATGQMMEGWI